MTAELARRAATAWSGRSRTLAGAGDLGLAVHAQWAADLATLHELLWESGLGAAPDPAAQLATVARMVEASFAQADDTPPEAGALVTWARNRLTSAFGAPVDALLESRFAPLDHLTGPVPPPAARATRSLDALRRDLRDAATDCATVARAMDLAGLADDARAQRRRAALATLEATLVARAAGAGDHALHTADLRWELAVAALPGQDRGDDGVGAGAWDRADVADLLPSLVAAADPDDQDTLRTRLESIA